MKKNIFKIAVFALAVVMFAALPAPVFAADAVPLAESSEMKVCNFCFLDFNPGAYENMAEITVTYSCNQYIFAGSVIKINIQKRFLGLFWKTVDIGVVNNEWTARSDKSSDVIVNQFPIDGDGTYRCNFKVTFVGKGMEVDTIEEAVDAKYNYVGK